MIHVTGETHCGRDLGDIPRWLTAYEGKLTTQDYLIILGDAGFGYAPWFDKFMNECGCTILVVPGNHENYPWIAKGQLVPLLGAEATQVLNNVFYLQTGSVYTISKKTFFCFGGATSVDKEKQMKLGSWHEEEVPTLEQFEQGLHTMKARKNKVDYVITHTAPKSIASIIKPHPQSSDIVESYLEVFYDLLNWNRWFCGHLHTEGIHSKYVRVLFNSVMEIL